MRLHFSKIKTGFTLVEVMITITLSVGIFAGIYQLLNVGNKSWHLNSGLISLQESARNIVWYISRDMRQCTDAITNTTLTNDGDSISFSTPSQTITYSVTTVPNMNVKQIERNNSPIGKYLTSLSLTESDAVVEMTVDVGRNVPLAGVKNFTLTGKAKRRNE